MFIRTACYLLAIISVLVGLIIGTDGNHAFIISLCIAGALVVVGWAYNDD